MDVRGRTTMSSGRGWLFWTGLVVTILGLVLLLLSSATLGYTVGVGVTCAGLILFGMGLGSRLKGKNARLGDVVLIAALIAAGGLAVLAFFVG
jgi:hypothetical protein